MDVPGATHESIEVKPGPVAGSVSVLATANPPKDANGTWLRAERGASGRPVRMARVLPVAWDAAVDKAKTRVENGLLVVTIPRQAPGQSDKEGEKKH